MALRGTTTGRHEYEFSSHVGHVRKANEDAAGACKDSGIVVVADGMGGHTEGAKASQIVVNEILESSRKGKTLVEAVRSADAAIGQYIQSNPSANGMGTTVVAARVKGNEYEIVWVGDSRAYFWHGGLKRLTRDHSMVQQRINAGVISSEDEFSQQDRNILERALIGQGIPEHEIGRISGRLYRDEALILCTDGLHGMATDAEIAVVVKSAINSDPSDALVGLALEKGGDDNVTVAVLKPAADAEQRSSERSTVEIPVVTVKKKSSAPQMLITLVIVIIFIAVFTWINIRKADTQPGGGALIQEVVTGESPSNQEPGSSEPILEQHLKGEKPSEAKTGDAAENLVQEIAPTGTTQNKNPVHQNTTLEEQLKRKRSSEDKTADTPGDPIQDATTGKIPINQEPVDLEQDFEHQLKGKLSPDKKETGAAQEAEDNVDD